MKPSSLFSLLHTLHYWCNVWFLEQPVGQKCGTWHLTLHCRVLWSIETWRDLGRNEKEMRRGSGRRRGRMRRRRTRESRWTRKIWRILYRTGPALKNFRNTGTLFVKNHAGDCAHRKNNRITEKYSNFYNQCDATVGSPHNHNQHHIKMLAHAWSKTRVNHEHGLFIWTPQNQ